MTLSQRLTRAGLVFVLFGTVAAVLPQQSGAARADDCTITGAVYRLTSNQSCSPDSSTATIHNSSTNGSTSIVLYTCFAANGTIFVSHNAASYSITGGHASVSPTSGPMTTVSANGTSTGTDTVTSTDTINGTTYTAHYTIAVIS